MMMTTFQKLRPWMLWQAAALVPMGLGFRQASVPLMSRAPRSYHKSVLLLASSSETTSTDGSSSSNGKPTIAFVTGNAKKLQEVQQILASKTDDHDNPLPLAFDIVNVALDLPEWQGDPLEIATEKCRLAAQLHGGACFTEDTSLCFDALNGLPGPYIKDFLQKCGHDGLNRMLDGFGSDNRGAHAQTVIAFCAGGDDDPSIHLFSGRTQGIIVPPRGPLDFGWDPIFQPNEGLGLTYAEMSAEAKNAISHRGRAMEQFRKFLINESNQILQEMQSADVKP